MDGLEDLPVAGAAADVPRQRLADLGIARLGVALKERIRGDDEPRRAEPALHRAGFQERLLQRMERRAAAEPFDGLDAFAGAGAGKDEAAADERAIEHHGARSALALLAGV